MPLITVSIDGVTIKEIQLTKDRTTLGRRPYNDIVIDNLAVSGEHAVLQMSGADVVLEDLNSTNGTYINGKAVKKQPLQNNDIIEIGKYRIKFAHDGQSGHGEKTTVINAGSVVPSATGSESITTAPNAAIQVLSGAAAGREMQLVKMMTTIGKLGAAVIAITRQSHGYVVALMESTETIPTINGSPIGPEAVNLNHGDLLELAGTQMRFIYSNP